MKKIVGIRAKLVTNTMILISAIFLIVLSVVTTINVASMNKNIRNSKNAIWNALLVKGRTLVTNNAMAMLGMRVDNAFSEIQTLVSSTVKNDGDIMYGIFMDENKFAWVYATKNNPSGKLSNRETLSDSLSRWASALKEQGYKSRIFNEEEVIEFAAPVVSSSDNILGVIRYGIGTKSLQESMNIALANGRAARNQSIVLLVLLCILSLGGGYFMIRRLAAAITKPIGSLVQSSKIIAEGNYDSAVISESNDEIGDLADHFESMRATIKKYADHLQDIIDDKMQQVNDILNNIDQGLFTFTFDGKINPEYSAQANSILKVENISNYTIFDLLRLDSNRKRDFETWLELVRRKHESQRWKKLVKLSPVQELELADENDNPASIEYISISYQKIFDKQGNLSKIMVLAMDETETRLKDRQMAEEKLRHENEVKTILGIANSPPDEIAEFMEDTHSRLRELHTLSEVHLKGVNKQRENYPDGPEYEMSEEQINAMYRDIHTIKGNGGSYGFEFLSSLAHQAESFLEQLRAPVKIRRADLLSSIIGILNDMDEAAMEIRKKIQLIFGKDEEISIRVPESRVRKIREICARLSSRPDPTTLSNDLISECERLSWKTLKTLTRKYQKIARKAARKLEKNIEFSVVDELAYYAPETLLDVDEALIHIVRNAVDHGIERPDVREELSKGIGRITFEFSRKDGKKIIKVSDDGRGIDSEKLIKSSIAKNVITPEEAAVMSEKEKLMLIFRSGVSTAETVTDISGRGMGMNIVEEKIRRLGGSIDIATAIGKGAVVTLIVPDAHTILQRT